MLAVTDSGWLVVSATDDGGTALAKSDFSDTLLLELTLILLVGQLRIAFAAADASRSITIRFETIGDELYRKAIGLILVGINPALTAAGEGDRNEAAMLEGWPLKIRNEAWRFWPSGQRFLAAIQWPAVLDGSQRQLAPAGALLITERELVVISDEKKPSAGEPLATDEVEETFAGIITFVPRARLAKFQVNHQEWVGVLALQLKAAHGGEMVDIAFPSSEEAAVTRAMGPMLFPRSSREPRR